MCHQEFSCVDGTTETLMPSARAATYRPRPGRPISAARPADPAETDLRQPDSAAPQQVYAECAPRDQLRDAGQVQPEVDQVERGQPWVERNRLLGQVEQDGLDEVEDRGVGAEPEGHREYDGDLDVQRAPVGLGQLLGRAHRS